METKQLTKHAFGLEWAHELQDGIMANLDAVSCLELIPENFLEGRFEGFLQTVAKKGTPVALHGVLLSIGSMEPLNEKHLDEVLEIGQQVNMVNFSEHLSLTQVQGVDLDALTPLAWNEDVLDEVCRKIDRIQSKLKVPFLIENVSNRFVVPDSDYSETEFINLILERTGCGLLLDVTNVFTNSVNFNFDPYTWLDEVNLKAVGLVHLAGGFYEPDGFLMDSHDNAVPKEAWDLYSYMARSAPPFTTIIERTGNFPRFEDLAKELLRAKRTIKKAIREERTGNFSQPSNQASL